ncbi:tRNA glutamyl-Q(34) synthetase GluQRS [Rhodovulum sp. DZ06]|uniref:tRNA glutamyl-Q(34) synthetase GluQRS n=1 Tax=Rhodovulum sp. DZ06 TaxID=3425126 RepID=UPI003D34C0AC
MSAPAPIRAPALHTERFAPSPNGRLHLGHAYSAILAHDAARAAGGRFLLRIEDIDRARARPEHEAAIFRDLAWLGLAWDGPVMRQSARGPAYAAALAALGARGLLYPCSCTRRDIAEALDAPQEGGAPAPGQARTGVPGPDGFAYPGTCRPATPAPSDGVPPEGAALRLNMRAAVAALGGAAAVGALGWEELGEGPEGQAGPQRLSPEALVERVGDVVIARKDCGTSYHLSVTVDDAAQGVTHVTRGRDLFHATQVHVLLEALLGLPSPARRHHRLIRDDGGKRLAKRDRAQGIEELRAEGATPQDIRRMVGLPLE